MECRNVFVAHVTVDGSGLIMLLFVSDWETNIRVVNDAMIALTHGSICSRMNGRHDSSSVNCESDELLDVLSFLFDLITICLT